jgi:hypothetical protein
MSDDKSLSVVEPAGKVLERYPVNSLPSLMAQHHPIHGLWGAAFEEIGGFSRLVEWIQEDTKNYQFFLAMLVKMAPPPSADLTIREMNVTVNNDLKRTPLDGEIEE